MSTSIASKTALKQAPSEPSIHTLLTREWIEEKYFNHLISSTQNLDNTIESNNTNKNNTQKSINNQRSLSKHLNKAKPQHLKNKEYENSKSDFLEALRWRKKPQQFKKYIESAYDKCRDAKISIDSSYDKLFMYSLLISSGFIYYSDFGTSYINGLRQIYFTLIDMNNDTQLCKDINTTLKKKIFWSDAEKKLINATIQFAVRLNQLIQIALTAGQVQYKNSGNVSISYSEHSDIKSDEKEPELDKYISSGDKIFWDMNWLPSYHNGYFFGKCTEKLCKFTVLSIKKFRKLMGADRMPYRVNIDDLVIHTYSLSNSGLYIKQHGELMHHWYSEKDWIDFEFVDAFKIGIHVINNGRVYGLNVNLYDTIKMIKNEIAKNEGGISPAMLGMDYNGKRLQDKCTLYDYQIGKGAKFRITLVTNNLFLNLVGPK